MQRLKIGFMSCVLALAACASGPVTVDDDKKIVIDSKALYEQAAMVAEKRAEYCNDYATSEIRKAAIAAIRAEVPLYPEAGLCDPRFGTLEMILSQIALQYLSAK